MVHGIIQGYGGSISAYSGPGGTTFNILIPAIKRKVLDIHPHEMKLPTGNERILFVDDEPALVNLGLKALKKLGYHVIPRKSSTEALDLFSQAPFDIDLVITDLTMPEMMGDQLAAALLKVRPELPIILCSGYSGHFSKSKMEQIGIKQLIDKPLVIGKLAHSIRDLLDNSN